MIITKNFKLHEFERSDIARSNKIDNVLPTSSIPILTTLCLLILQPLRDYVGEPIKINSGYRCPKLNAHPRINGQEDSQHIYSAERGAAADIFCGGANSHAIANAIVELQLPFDQLIYEPPPPNGNGFVHVSVAGTGFLPRGEIMINSRTRHYERISYAEMQSAKA